MNNENNEDNNNVFVPWSAVNVKWDSVASTQWIVAIILPKQNHFLTNCCIPLLRTFSLFEFPTLLQRQKNKKKRKKKKEKKIL